MKCEPFCIGDNFKYPGCLKIQWKSIIDLTINSE